MKIEEFKALPSGTKVMWDDRECVTDDGVFVRHGNAYRIDWNKHGTASGEFSKLNNKLEWVSMIKVAPNYADVKVQVPHGYEATGEFREPNPQIDCYLHQDGVTVVEAKPGNQPCLGPRVILKRIVPPSLSERLREYVRAIGNVIDATPIQIPENLLRRVTLGEVRCDLSRMLTEFDAAESKV